MVKTQKGGVKLFFILMLMHYFFYLAPDQIGPLSLFNIQFLLGGIIIVFCFLKEKGKFVVGEFGYIILIIPVMIVFSAIGAKLHYDQGIISGLATQRAWLVTAWLYFAIMYLIRREEITYDSLVQVLYAVVTVELVLYFTQYFLGEQNMFLNVMYKYRNGSIRLYCRMDYMYLLILIAAENVLKKKRIAINLVYIVAIVLYYVLVNKGRSVMIQLALALGLVLLLNRDIPKKWKVLALATAGILGVVFILNTDYLRDMVAVVFKQKKDASWGARTGAYKFYLEKWVSTPYAFLFGYGYGNSSIEASQIATGMTQHYLLADNGVLGFISCYGLLGLVWYGIYTFMLIRAGIRIYRKNNSTVLFARCTAELIAITTGCGFFYAYNAFEIILLTVVAELTEIEAGKGNLRLFPRRRTQTMD